MNVNNCLRELIRESEELSKNVKQATARPQIEVEELRTFMKAPAKGNPVEIKRFIGECVEGMALPRPDEIRVTIQ